MATDPLPIWPDTASIVTDRCAPFAVGEIVTIEDYFRAEGDYRAAWCRSESDRSKVGPIPVFMLSSVRK